MTSPNSDGRIRCAVTTYGTDVVHVWSPGTTNGAHMVTGIPDMAHTWRIYGQRSKAYGAYMVCMWWAAYHTWRLCDSPGTIRSTYVELTWGAGAGCVINVVLMW